MLVAIAIMGTGINAFCEDGHTGFFKKSYAPTKTQTATQQIANDVRSGRLPLEGNVNELSFINLQLNNWNSQASQLRILNNWGGTFQLISNFTKIGEARSYFADIIEFHCFDSLWQDHLIYKLDRVNARTGAITSDWARENKVGEMFVALDLNTFRDEISAADGYAVFALALPGFSEQCGNKINPEKGNYVPPPKRNPPANNVPNQNSYDDNSWRNQNPYYSSNTSGNVTNNFNIVNEYNNTTTTPAAPAAPTEVYQGKDNQLVKVAWIAGVAYVVGQIVKGVFQPVQNPYALTQEYRPYYDNRTVNYVIPQRQWNPPQWVPPPRPIAPIEARTWTSPERTVQASTWPNTNPYRTIQAQTW